MSRHILKACYHEGEIMDGLEEKRKKKIHEQLLKPFFCTLPQACA